MHWLIAILTLITGTGVCRYTVRDIGFIDLQSTAYRLCFVTPNDATFDLSASRAALRDSPVEPLVIDSATRPEHPAVKALGGSAGVVLVDGADRVLRLDPDGPLSEALESPARILILEKIIDTFGVVVLFESDSAAENARARAAIDRSIERLGVLEEHLPRPIGPLPVTVTVAASDRANERVLEWSLGVSPSETAVAVLYGRLKRAGPVLNGEQIDEREITAQLALVGESCECETDRDWALEPVVPVRWDDALRKRAVEQLGFDPESPMVRVEVARILEQGPGGRAPQIDDSLDAMLLGYSETSLNEGLSGSDDTTHDTTHDTTSDTTSDRTAPDVTETESAHAAPDLPVLVPVDREPEPTHASLDGDDETTSDGFGLLGVIGAIVLVSIVGVSVVLARRRPV